jgi:hypothetical protein
MSEAPQGWSPWELERRYLADDGEHVVRIFKRTVRYGDDVSIRWKNDRIKLTSTERAFLAGLLDDDDAA